MILRCLALLVSATVALSGSAAFAGDASRIVSIGGAVEVAPRLKLAQAICDLVSTGATLEANGLVAVDTVLQSEAVLIRAPTSTAPALHRAISSTF